jgi:aldehyde dehydrogenase
MGQDLAGRTRGILNKIADRMEANLQLIATAETIDNGKPIRETLAADIPLAIDHFRYFAGCMRAQEGSIAQIDANTYAYHFHEPLGVVGQIIPWNFPILMAVWKLAPALAAGNCVVLKPAEQTPASIMVLVDLIADLLPPGVVNMVNGFGLEAGKPLASSKRIAKIAFTGETGTGRLIMGYAAQNLIPVTLELGGKSPNIFFEDVMDADDDFFDKCLEGFAMFALNQGEVCTCPSRVLVQESIYEKFIERALERVAKIKQGNPLDPNTMIGAQASQEQLEKILSYIDIGKQEGAQVLAGGERNVQGGDMKAATTCVRPCSRATTACASSRKRSSARWCRSPPSRTKRMRCASPTTPCTAWAPACGRATVRAPSASAAPSRPAACGPTATTCIRRTPHSAATSSRASAARTTR